MRPETNAIHAIPVCELTGSIGVPVYQTSTFVQEAPGKNQGFDYSRSNNPTRQVLENLIANLEGGDAGFAFASGLAAIDAVLKLLKSGDEIVAVDDIYGGTFRLLTHIYEKFGITVKYVDSTEHINVLNAISSKTKLVWIETPTNPTLKISDIAEIAKITHAQNALLVVDNTFASPALQQPIKLGADIIVHSATKYLAGHSDVIAGLVVTATPELSAKIKFNQNSSGGVLGPWDSWLTIRGIETLHLRIEKQCENSEQIAAFLAEHPLVDRVNYPGLKSHKNHNIAKRQQSKFGAVISFSLKEDTQQAAINFVTNTQLFKLAESLGGVKSLLCHPANMTHKGTPKETRLAAGIQESLIRLSVGTEHFEDLIADLEAAFEKIKNSKKLQETA